MEDKPVNPPHRPARVFTAIEIAECKDLADVLSQKQLAMYFGCTPNTLRAAFDRQHDLSEAYRKGKALGITRVAKSLAQKALDGDVNAAKFYLSHQAGWTETKRTEISGPDGDPIDVDMHWTVEVVNSA
jgi:hypothetical protein